MDQCPVAGLVPAVVVDPLEAVHVDDDEADHRAVGAVAVDRRVQPVVDRSAVRQPGQRVGVGQPGLRLDVLGLRDTGGDLAGHRHRVVHVVRAEGLRVAVTGGEQLAPYA